MLIYCASIFQLDDWISRSELEENVRTTSPEVSSYRLVGRVTMERVTDEIGLLIAQAGIKIAELITIAVASSAKVDRSFRCFVYGRGSVSRGTNDVFYEIDSIYQIDQQFVALCYKLQPDMGINGRFQYLEKSITRTCVQLNQLSKPVVYLKRDGQPFLSVVNANAV